MSKIYKTTYSLLKSTQMDQNNNKFNGNNRNNGQQYQRPQQNTQSNQPQPQSNAAENVLNRVRSNKVTNAIEIGFAVVGAGTVLYNVYTKAIKPGVQYMNAKVVKPIVAKFSKKPATEPAPEKKPAGE